LTNSLTGQFGFGYDALSRRTQLTRPNGINTNYSYDSVSHLLSVLHQAGSTTLDGASYGYDFAGNRTSKTDNRTGTASGYGYDAIYQLQQVTQGGSTTESYTYDAVGNRLSSTGVPSYSYNPSNELTSNSSGSYTYDNNGNALTDASGRTFTWDFENRLIQAIVPGTGTTTFKYDAFGRRIQKSGPLGTTNYLYDGMNPLEEVDSAGSVLARYTLSNRIDDVLSALRASTTSYYEQNGVGSVTSLSNSAATIANTYTYDSFGKLVASTGTQTNPFRFTGREFDSETGLYNYRSRHFDPVIGRFTEEDAIGFNGGKNFYAYVENNPVTEVDALGLAKCIYSITAHTLVCIPDADPGWPAIIGPNGEGAVQLGPGGVWSGVKACANNTGCIHSHDLGPIVPGNYNMNPDNRTGHAGFWRLEPNPKIPGWECRLGLARCGFELHPGSISLGCITTNKTDPNAMQEYDSVNNLLNQESGSNHLTVVP
jgi:RHS repeat-associated protein